MPCSRRRTRLALIASAAIPLTVVGLSAAPARAANECGVPNNGTVICVPGVYPSGITYSVVSDLAVTLQQTPSAAVTVQDGGINLSSPFQANTTANLALTQSFVGSNTTQYTTPSIANSSGTAVTAVNFNGAVTINLGVAGSNSGIALVGSTNGIDVTSRDAATVIVENGSITAHNGAGILINQTGPSGAISVTTSGTITALAQSRRRRHPDNRVQPLKHIENLG